jgi:hypothetical protein
MMRFICLIIYIAISGQVFTQTFSRLYPLSPYPASVFNAVLVTDTAYFITGIVADSVPPYGTKPLFLRTDTNGDIEVLTVHYDQEKNYETWNQGLYFDEQGNIVTNGYIFNHPERNWLIFFIRYSQEGEVDTIIEFSYRAGYVDIPYPMLQNQKKEFIIPVQSNINNLGTNVLFFLNNSGEVKSHITYNPNHRNLGLFRMDTTKNGFVLGGYQPPPGPVKNGKYLKVIIEFDSLGNKIWEYESPVDERWCGTLGGIVSNNRGEIIYVSGEGYICDPNAVSDVVCYKWYATKLDRDKNIVWRTHIPSTSETVLEGCYFWNILKLKDQKSYITMGMDFEYVPLYYGWLAKFSDDGDLLWIRKYNVEDQTNTFYVLRDLAEDADGNLIAAGERLSVLASSNLQQGWLMKLDQHGCLVPGCELVSTSDLPASIFDIQIYPNPASEFISFYIHPHLGAQVDAYSIVDMSGKVLISQKTISPDVHYVIQTHDFPDGMYVILFSKNAQMVHSKKFLVSH